MTRRSKSRPRPGKCVVCGCTDERGCDIGCQWADPSRTLCSCCIHVQFRVTGRYTNDSADFVIFGLWVVDGGPEGRGHWMVDISAVECDGHPAVFFDRAAAEKAAAEENDPRHSGIASSGWRVEVVPLQAVQGTERPRKSRKPKR